MVFLGFGLKFVLFVFGGGGCGPCPLPDLIMPFVLSLLRVPSFSFQRAKLYLCAGVLSLVKFFRSLGFVKMLFVFAFGAGLKSLV